MSFYRRTSADVAFVRTGQGGSTVVLDGGIRVFPFLHKVLEINLRTMKLGVNPRGQNALITRDNLRRMCWRNSTYGCRRIRSIFSTPPAHWAKTA